MALLAAGACSAPCGSAIAALTGSTVAASAAPVVLVAAATAASIPFAQRTLQRLRVAYAEKTQEEVESDTDGKPEDNSPVRRMKSTVTDHTDVGAASVGADFVRAALSQKKDDTVGRTKSALDFL
eukprot:TRINITY_DN51667_c0_g1_i1.p2 TRINITY_DN51667_c0_g1~~TRINITY_DN51667_c0_g1_i1.p2  ORF type:complete len:125 (-),score=27.63 TRINITY_DN51667_c0_g1_i1:109-483(-)